MNQRINQEHVFKVDFFLLTEYANNISNEVYKKEILERINKYLNDQNELKLSSIIDFTNDITVVKEVLFPEDKTSIDNVDAITEYLQKFVHLAIFS